MALNLCRRIDLIIRPPGAGVPVVILARAEADAAPSSFLDALVPVNPHVSRLSPHRDDVDLAVAVKVGTGEVFDGDAARIEQHAGPFRAFVVNRFVDADTTAG